MVVDAVSNEKGVEIDIIFEAIEAAWVSALRKHYGEEAEVLVTIDRESGNTVAVWPSTRSTTTEKNSARQGPR